jgi:hypothetical protein
MVYEVANGVEDDGIKYRVQVESPEYVVTVTHPDGRELIERYHWIFEPRFGPDVADVARGEEIMDRLIAQFRSGLPYLKSSENRSTAAPDADFVDVALPIYKSTAEGLELLTPGVLQGKAVRAGPSKCGTQWDIAPDKPKPIRKGIVRAC